MPLDLDWLNRVQANRNAVEHCAMTLFSRRSFAREWEAAWLLRAIRCMDLTSLSGDDTAGTIRQLCSIAKHPVRDDLLNAMNVDDLEITTAAVCVYPTMIAHAYRVLAGSGIAVASVAAGFPAGLNPFKLRLEEITYAVEAGATEIDAVVTREHILTGSWEKLYEEVASFREACGDACLKVILATGEIATLRDVQRASLVAMMGGADFLETSTGKGTASTGLETGLAMLRAIREYAQRTGYRIGFKVSGCLRHAKDALHWLILLKEELGREWLEPESFRIGASNLLADIERQLEFCAPGHHPTGRHRPIDA
jgi:deoxyribose-phosphate aldolase